MKTIKNQMIDMMIQNGEEAIKQEPEEIYNEIIETYLNGNISDFGIRFNNLNAGQKYDFTQFIKNDQDIPELKKINMVCFLLLYEYREEKQKPANIKNRSGQPADMNGGNYNG